MQKQFLAAVVASVVAGQAMAVTIVENDNTKFAIGGHAGARYEYDRGRTDNRTQAIGDSSRINFQFESKLNEDVTAFARTEWGFDTSNLGNEFKFNGRLGFVGVKGDFGAISLGKQWSAYSQVSNWTDTFATADAGYGMYNDSEVLGTGRADGAIQYNLSVNGLNIAAQYQTGGKSAQSMEVEFDKEGDVVETLGKRTRDAGYQLAVSYDLPMGLSAGIAYNHVQFVEKGIQNAKALALSVKFEDGPVYAAATYADHRNQAVFSDAEHTVVSKRARNIELVGGYQLNENFSVQTGFMQLKDKNHSDIKDQNVPVELVYTAGPIQLSGTYTFEQSRVGNEREGDKFVTQARYYF